MALACGYQPRRAPPPAYNGTVRCHHCWAEYKPGKWVYGAYHGSATQFVVYGKVPDGCCPICRTPADPGREQ